MRILGKEIGKRVDTVEEGKEMLENGDMVDNTAVSEQTIPDDIPGVIDDVTDEDKKEEKKNGN